MKVGERIKRYLEENGIKQTFVADKAGITVSKMNDICNRGKSIDCVTYYKVCTALGVPLESFLQEEE